MHAWVHCNVCVAIYINGCSLERQCGAFILLRFVNSRSSQRGAGGGGSCCSGGVGGGRLLYRDADAVIIWREQHLGKGERKTDGYFITWGCNGAGALIVIIVTIAQ